MSLSLSVSILLVGSLLSSSASILETKKLTPEELSPTKSPVGSPITSPVTSPTSLATLTGYVATVTYSDYSTCKNPLTVHLQVLNTCHRTGENTYEYVTATSSSVRTVTYTDALCTLGAMASNEIYSDGACFYGRKTFISLTSTFTTDLATANIR